MLTMKQRTHTHWFPDSARLDVKHARRLNSERSAYGELFDGSSLGGLCLSAAGWKNCRRLSTQKESVDDRLFMEKEADPGMVWGADRNAGM